MSNRGIVELTLNGEVFELHPTFENLDKLETVLNKGAVGFLQNDLSSGMFKTGDLCLLSKFVLYHHAAQNVRHGGIVKASGALF